MGPTNCFVAALVQIFRDVLRSRRNIVTYKIVPCFNSLSLFQTTNVETNNLNVDTIGYVNVERRQT